MIQYCNGYFPNTPQDCKDKFGNSWKEFVKNQTLALSDAGDNTAVQVFFHGLQIQDLPQLPHTLLEQMAWALLARPEWDILIQPLHASIASETKKIYDGAASPLLTKIIESGYKSAKNVDTTHQEH